MEHEFLFMEWSFGITSEEASGGHCVSRALKDIINIKVTGGEGGQR